MKRIDIFKKMENDCLTAVHTAAISYGIHNVEVLIQSRRMKVTVFAGKGTVSYTIFSTGKLVIQSTDNIKEIEPLTEESVLEELATGKTVDEIAAAAPAPPAPPAPPKPETDLVIYQLKGGEATRDIRFESYDSLAKQGMTPDIANYDLVYEGRMADVTDSTDLRMQLEAVFHKFNMDRPEDFTGHSLSVSDVVVVRDQAFYVDSFGFKPLPEFLTPKLTAPELTAADSFLESLPGRLQSIVKRTVDPMEDNLLKVCTDAAKLKIDPSQIREAANLIDDEKVDIMAENYALFYRTGLKPENPYKHKPKKPKL